VRSPADPEIDDDDRDELPPAALLPPPVLAAVESVIAPPVLPEPLPPIRFPIVWMFEHAAPPLRYRALKEVAQIEEAAADVSWMPYAFVPAIQLMMAQSPDGTWHRAMMSLPGKGGDGVEGVGTVHAIRRLLEYGWDKDSPPLVLARRMLFRLLAEDDDPTYLFELAPRGKFDEDLATAERQLLREAAAATLAQAGYEADPRLRGAARRIIDRTADFLASPLAEKPWIRVGNKQVLSPEAAPPSIYTLHMLAHLPLVRTENHVAIEAIHEWITRPMPRQEPVQLVGKRMVPVPFYVLGDPLPHRNALEEDVPAAVLWLELMARMGFLKRQEHWMKLFDRFVDDCDRRGVWHPHKGMDAPSARNPYVWPAYPIQPPTADEARWSDVTFRVGLIARLTGRQVELV
jgi:hypothetical protein